MSQGKGINLTLLVWRQKDPADRGRFETFEVKDVDPNMSFPEMLDSLNESLLEADQLPIEFDNDCREGICGTCGAMVNGIAHGSNAGMTLCQLHMRAFDDGDTIVVEPFRARAFKVIKDLIVDRTPLETIIQAGGYVSVNTGGVPDANTIPIAQDVADEAMDAAECVGCGACVASCPSASAMLFVSAKVSQLALLPQGHSEARKRVVTMLDAMDQCGFGNCSNHRACEAACPKQISISHIARFNRELLKAGLFGRTKIGS